MTLEQALSAAEWQKLLDGGVGAILVLDLQLHVVAATSTCPSIDEADCSQLIGRRLGQVWRESAAEAFAASVVELEASLENTLHEATLHSVNVRWDGGDLEDPHQQRSFRVANVPVFIADRLAFIIHREEETTAVIALIDRLRESDLSDDHHRNEVTGAAAQRIAQAGTEFERVRADLEQRLAARTADLQSANAQLLLEIAEHMRTEKALRHSQEQLQHAQKLEAVGLLAGGIAHDFNNLLSVILGYASTMLEDLAPDAALRADVAEIQQAGERAATLTKQLLAFSRRQVLKPEVVDLNETIQRMVQMLRRLVGEDIELTTRPGSALWKIKVDPGQIEQVIMNLVVNARDAMPEGGTLQIETGCVDLDAEYTLTHLGVTPGPHVMLAITDTGIGMSKAIQKRVFEPFFTTKETGKGTGLGLSMVFGIVNQSGGHIWLDSEPGKGTCVRIYLPQTIERLTIRPAERLSLPVTRHRETIQLCEDEDQVRTLARKVLERRGYRVLEAARPLDAIAMVAAYGETIDLLITDMVMPQMGGRELARRLNVMRPAMKVLYMSGYTDSGVVNNGILESGLAFIQKPIRPETFALKVRQVLDEDGSAEESLDRAKSDRPNRSIAE